MMRIDFKSALPLAAFIRSSLAAIDRIEITFLSSTSVTLSLLQELGLGANDISTD